MAGRESLRGKSPDEVFAWYRQLEASQSGEVSDYVGYSERTLKRVVLEVLASFEPGRLVELGCGPNPVVLFELARRGWQIAAVDLSEGFCRNARELAQRHGLALDIRQAPAHETPFDSGVHDAVLLTEVLEHVPDEFEAPTLAEAHRLLCPGGHLLVSVPNPKGLFPLYQRLRAGMKPEDHPGHIRFYSPRRLRAALTRAGFTPLSALTVPAWAGEGKAARLIDAVTLRPEWSTKIAILARA